MAERIKLYEKDGKVRAHSYAAGIASDSKEFEAMVKKVHSHIKGKATAVRDTGDFAKSIKVTESRYKDVKDRVIYSDDPAAYAIERGFRRTKKDGTVVHVPGKHIFQGVLDGGI